MWRFLFDDANGNSVTWLCDSWETAEALAKREGWELLGRHIETIYDDPDGSSTTIFVDKKSPA